MESIATPNWKKLELLVAEIQKDLSPGATITHNAFLKGLDSETDRQIDVLVEQHIGQYPIRIIIDCKDHAKAVDVPKIEAFNGMIKDVGAHQGAMVCPKGFSASAKKIARRNKIDIYTLVDTDPHKWTCRVSLPVLCDFRSASLAFSISCTAPVPMKLAYDFYTSLVVVNEHNLPLGTCLAIAVNQWNEGLYPHDVGDYEGVPLLKDQKLRVDNGYGTLVEVSLTLSISVSARRYFGNLPVEKIRGLRDEQTGLVHTNAFTTGALSASEVEEKWSKLDPDAEPPKDPAIRVMGLICWPIEQ